MPDTTQFQVPPCPKCGCTTAPVTYVPEDDKMALRCPRCGYWWQVPPLNSEAGEECCQGTNDVFISISVRGTNEVHVSIDKGQED